MRFFDLLEKQHGLARTRQAQRLGLPADRLRWWIRRGRLRRVEYGIVAASGAPVTPAFRRMRGVLLGGHGLTEGVVAALCGVSAAHQLDLLSTAPDEVHVLSTRQIQPRPNYSFHRTGRLPSSEVVFSDGIPTTDPIRTFLDCSAFEPPWRARNLYHRALRDKRFEREDVLERIDSEARQGRPGLCLAREIAEGTSPGAEKARSAWEETVFDWIADASLPLPERNAEVQSSFGFPWEIDLLYRVPPTAIEVSPWEWHSDPDTYKKDLRKRADLEALGFKVIVVSDLSERDRFLKDLTSALSRRV